MIIKSRLLVLTSLVLLLAACARETQPANTFSTPDVFTRPQQPADTRSGALPEDLAEHTDIDPDSLRLLGTQDEWSFYAARSDDTGEVCIINVVENSDEPAMATGCAGPVQFSQSGAWVVLGTGPDYGAAVFFPDGYTDSVRDTFPHAFVQDNLLAFTSSEAVADAIDQHGGRVELTGDVQGDLTISLAALR
jgi:hypothetical protein